MLSSFALEDNLVVVGQRARELAILNPSGRFIWECRELGWDADRIAACLAEAYGIGAQMARADVAACLESWERAGLLVDATVEEEAEDPECECGPAEGPYCRPAGSAVWENYRLGGQAFRVSYASADLRAAAAPLLAHLATASAGGARRTIELSAAGGEYALLRDGRCVERPATRDGLMFALHRELLNIGYDREWCESLHASAISNGKESIVLAGPGGAGKSTLTAVLL